MGVTIKQIAAKAGVSKATVSRVLNGLGVKYETEQKVKAIIEKMQYRPHRFARGLANRQTGYLGLVAPSLDPYVASVVLGMEEEAGRHGKLLTLGVFSLEDGDEREVIRTMTEPPVVDGLLFFLPSAKMETLLRSLLHKKFPVVVVSERRYENLVPSVVVDNVNGALQAIQYLIGKGHRRIGFVKGRADTSDSADRLEGYRRALAEAGIAFDDGLVLPGNYDIRSGEEAAARFLEMSQPPTAVFASNDGMAIGVLKALQAKKREGAFAVMGFDDIEMAALVSPSLTTIGYDLHELGRQSVHKLMRMIVGEEKSQSVLQLKTHLVARESA